MVSRVAGLITIKAAGVQRWIVGGFTELRFVRGGSELLTEAFSAAGEHAVERGGRLVVGASGALSVYTSGAVAEMRNVLVAEFLSRMPDLPLIVTIQPDGEASITVREGVRGYPPGIAVCAFTGDAGATGLYERDRSSYHRSDSIKRRLDVIAGTIWHDDVSFEMTEIGEITPGRFAGYVGVVLADGDGIGELVADAWSSSADRSEQYAEVRQLNLRLAEESAALLGAASEAGSRLLGDRFRWNPVIAGGDDITLVVPACAAPSMALALSSRPDVDGSPAMAASVAVFLCKATYPFHLATEAAEVLLHTAKQRSRTSGVGPMIHLQFELGSISAQDRWGFPGGPYSRCEFDAMVRWASAESPISASTLRSVADAVSEGGRTAVREWRLHTGTTGSGVGGDLTGLGSVLAKFGDGSSPFGQDGESSPIGDLVDLRSLLNPDLLAGEPV